MFVDNVVISIKAGDGGNGAATFLRNGMTAKGGPDGGNGGNGGNIYFQGSNNLNDLKEFRFKKKIIAENGTNGKHRKLFGKNAEHTTILVPIGTSITDISRNKKIEIIDTETRVLLAKGGIGGRGNNEFKSATNQAPVYAEQGTKGQEKTLELELKIIADIGLIGFPNAGKSSLLSVLTRANPKIGDYPFTTLEPNRGILQNYTLADIPGLIEGASVGKGLGITFLKHIEKTKLLLHCIDCTTPDPVQSYKTIRKEFGVFNTSMLEKPEIILLTKTDLLTSDEINKVSKKLAIFHKTIITVSIYDELSLQKLTDYLIALMEHSNAQKSL